MDLTPYRKALELIASKNWDGAHAIVQELETREAAIIHAYLHRVEGDIGNAHYWYRRAGQSAFVGSIEEEFLELKARFS